METGGNKFQSKKQSLSGEKGDFVFIFDLSIFFWIQEFQLDPEAWVFHGSKGIIFG